MAVTILTVLVMLEIGLAVYRIMTKVGHTTVRSKVRIATFAGFVLLAILTIIEWSLRYYALFTQIGRASCRERV